eukprot:2471669-Pyramimonas_sp.AAC.1
MNTPWGSHVSASDASPIGVGVCTRKEVVPRVAELERQAERWRYRCTSAVSARANALGLGGPPRRLRHHRGFLGLEPRGLQQGLQRDPRGAHA